MKLSTKIIIGLAALTVICSFLFFIVMGKVAEHFNREETYGFGPIRTLRIQSPNRSGFSDSLLKCTISPGDDNTASYTLGWPVTGKAEFTYNPSDSSLTVSGISGKDGMGYIRVNITVGSELERLIVDGNTASVYLETYSRSAMVVDADNANVVLNDCRFGSLLASAKNDYSRFYIDRSTKIDSLFYSVSDADAISFSSDSIGAMIAMPGSVRIESDEEIFDTTVPPVSESENP